MSFGSSNFFSGSLLGGGSYVTPTVYGSVGRGGIGIQPGLRPPAPKVLVRPTSQSASVSVSQQQFSPEMKALADKQFNEGIGYANSMRSQLAGLSDARVNELRSGYQQQLRCSQGLATTTDSESIETLRAGGLGRCPAGGNRALQLNRPRHDEAGGRTKPARGTWPASRSTAPAAA